MTGTELAGHATRALVAALIGGSVGWGANSLAISGRVEAIEKGQARLEVLMLALLERKGVPAPLPDAK